MVLALGGLAVLHAYWRKKFQRAEEAAERRVVELKASHQQAAAQIESQQDALLNSMAEGLLLLDGSGRISLANRALTSLFGVTGELRKKTIMEALRQHELAELVEFMGDQKRALGYELKLPPPNERWLQINGAAIFDHEGKRQGTVLVFHDLTRLKQLEYARKEFVANVSHELRTPLSLIKGYVETLLDGAKDNPEVAVKFLNTIERNADRLSLLIQDLLTISELESGRVKLDIRLLALRSVVEKSIEDLKASAAARQVTLHNQAPDLNVLADAGRLEQVLGNFIDNAIKYGRLAGTVTVGGRMLEGDFVEIFVQDNGPGIPADALERVFERFYRLDKARSREQGGTGLGLSIVKHIVQSHGGRVWATSEVGQGATFHFTLPLAPAAAPPPV